MSAVTVNDIYKYLNHFAPFDIKLDGDNIGLLIGDPNREVSRVLVSLDVTESVADEATAINADLIISHHSVIFKPINKITYESGGETAVVYKLIRHGIAQISCHTNLDITSGGVNDALAERLELKDIKKFGFCPELMGLGRVGTLSEEYSCDEFAAYIKNRLNTSVRYYDSGKSIKTVAVIGGGGSDYISEACAAGAQALVSADARYKNYRHAQQLGISLFDAGHYATENVIVEPLCGRLRLIFPQTDIVVSKANTDIIKFC